MQPATKRFPFDDDPQEVWNKNPKLDAPLLKVPKKSSLAFEDMGYLKDCMNKRRDIVLKRAWETSLASLKPELARTCVSNLDFWLSQLQNHVKNRIPRKEVPAGSIADASAESVKLVSRQ